MIRRVVLWLLAFAVMFLAATYALVTLLSWPDQKQIGPAPADLHAQAVRIPSRSGTDVHGWFVPGRSQGGAVLLLHGVHANRLAMLQRARFLVAAGYAVLLIDFQAHGESSGRRITFGYLESLDARAAFDYLRQAAPGERIGVVGVSMGGAATVLAEPPLPADAFVLEQVYSTIEEALDNRLRLRLGALGTWIAPLIRMQMSWHLAVDANWLHPVEHIAALRAPVLMIAGEQDQHTTLEQSRALFAAANEPKQLWVVAGAAHVDLSAYAGAEYERRLLDFLAPLLRPAQTQPTALSIPSAATSTMKSISSGVMQ